MPRRTIELMGAPLQNPAVTSSEPVSYYRARYYDPGNGRFLSEDPLGFGAGSNFYSYVGNDPTAFVDPGGAQQAGSAAPSMPPLIGPQPGRPILVPDPTPAPPVSGFWPSTLAEAGAAVALIYYEFQLAKIEIDMIRENNERNTPQPDPTKKPSTCNNNGGNDPCKGIRDQLREHELKLQQYASNPYAFDNKSILGRGRDDAIIAGRVRSLLKQIQDFRKQLEECERAHGIK